MWPNGFSSATTPSPNTCGLPVFPHLRAVFPMSFGALMATHTPHYPDQLFESAWRLRRWENALMDLFEAHGYPEFRPSLVLRDPIPETTVRFFDGRHLSALRWDFTLALARSLVRRFQEPPARVAYAGSVFRYPEEPWEPIERFEVGCERIQSDGAGRSDADLEVARLMMAVPQVLGLKGCTLRLGNAALLSRPMEAEGLDEPLRARLARCLDRRAVHRAEEVMEGHPAAGRLKAHLALLAALPEGEPALAGLAKSPYAGILEEELETLGRTMEVLHALLPAGLSLRLDLAEVRGHDFYTGPTLRLWAPGAQRELAAGGRYDRLFPGLGRPWFAAGFCVRLTSLLDLAEARPEFFDGLSRPEGCTP